MKRITLCFLIVSCLFCFLLPTPVWADMVVPEDMKDSIILDMLSDLSAAGWIILAAHLVCFGFSIVYAVRLAKETENRRPALLKWIGLCLLSGLLLLSALTCRSGTDAFSELSDTLFGQGFSVLWLVFLLSIPDLLIGGLVFFFAKKYR